MDSIQTVHHPIQQQDFVAAVVNIQIPTRAT
jgi:hypothetical protein